MRWLANENFPSASVAHLQAAGEDVAEVVEDARAIADTEVLEWARREQRIILTFDRDYGELIYWRNCPRRRASSISACRHRIPKTRLRVSLNESRQDIHLKGCTPS